MARDGALPPRGPASPGRGGEIYLEFVPVGKMVRVVAVDAATGTEATIVGPHNAARTDLERIAVRKLRMVLARK